MSSFKNISGEDRTVPNVGAIMADETREVSPDLDQYFDNSPHFQKVEEKKSKKASVETAPTE